MRNQPKAIVTLPSDNQLLITRDFAAPRASVYRAYTTPELVARWWAGQRGKVTSIEIDLRVGGAWRYVMTANAGFEVAFHGEYREIVTDERLVQTEVFEMVPDAEAVDEVSFTEADGVTTVRVLVTHRSQAERDLHLESGMEDGMNEAMDLLEEIARTL